jgi:hypothetical protein
MGGTPSSFSGVEGYHVLAVEIDSPADLAGLEPYFDFIVGIDSVDLVSSSCIIIGGGEMEEGGHT